MNRSNCSAVVLRMISFGYDYHWADQFNRFDQKIITGQSVAADSEIPPGNSFNSSIITLSSHYSAVCTKTNASYTATPLCCIFTVLPSVLSKVISFPASIFNFREKVEFCLRSVDSIHKLVYLVPVYQTTQPSKVKSNDYKLFLVKVESRCRLPLRHVHVKQLTKTTKPLDCLRD
ncbi:Uncharacterized protein Adt_21246 [Abeliophyllum distichum]|uniref:Uncharacterized protein n=1 Tax=Abeliophyllum distichum TaxID=126358 RepID=A0ABD1SYX3_9LAMI